MKTLEDINPTRGSVHTIRSSTFPITTVVCVKVTAEDRASRFQFCPVDENGIARDGLYWDSVYKDEVLESWPNLRAYLAATNGQPAVAAEPPVVPPEENPEMVRRTTACLRAADAAHVKAGGGTRHFIRECWLPILAEHGLQISLIEPFTPPDPQPAERENADPIEEGRRAVLKTLSVAREGLDIDHATRLLQSLENDIGDQLGDLATMQEQSYE